jgi:hypothetical protein
MLKREPVQIWQFQREPVVKPSKGSTVQRKPSQLAVAEYLAREGFGDKDDEEDPSEDTEDTEEIEEVEPARAPIIVQRAQPGVGGKYCEGNCGTRHRCLGGCRGRVKASYARPCPWEANDRMCDSCSRGEDDAYDGSDPDDYYDR